VGEIIVALVTGLLGGFAGGLLGIGGGTFYIPAMVLLLDEQQHVAQGASLAAMTATAFVGGLTHLRRGNVHLPSVAFVAPAAVVAGFSGALLADVLDEAVLRRVFAVVMLSLSFTMILGVLRARPETVKEEA
jgi:uncharacterized membrane protein YfcA